MNIETLGSIAELIAAIATIATLFYLAVQIRGSTVVARAEAQREAQSGGVSAQLAIAQDSDLAALLRKGLESYPNLEPVDATRFSVLLSSLLNGPMLIARDAQLGLANQDDLDICKSVVIRFLSTPGGEAWFNENTVVLPKAFVLLVKEELSQD